VPVPGLYWADAASIGPVLVRYWQLMACLQCTTRIAFQWIKVNQNILCGSKKNYVDGKELMHDILVSPGMSGCLSTRVLAAMEVVLWEESWILWRGFCKTLQTLAATIG